MQPAHSPVLPTAPRAPLMTGWTGWLAVGLAGYVLVAIVLTVAGPGSGAWLDTFILFSDFPASATVTLLAAVAALRATDPAARRTWQLLAAALGVYSTGNLLNSLYWYFDRDPFPSVGDVFFLAFYPLLFGAVVTVIRASALRAPWARLVLDSTILILGFGAFFWFFVIQPTATAEQDPDVLKYALTQAYIALNCLMVLAFGVLLMNSGDGPLGRRTLVLLTFGFATMFLADIVWAMSKVTGEYLPGGLSDAIYLSCYAWLGIAAREQLRGRPVSEATPGAVGTALIQGLPYLAMLASFLVLVYFESGEVDTPSSTMTMIIFALTLLVMLRQGVVSREDAVLRARRAASLVEARYASLIRNASDVIVITATDGQLRFVSPAAERTFGRTPGELLGTSLFELCPEAERDRLVAFFDELIATRGRPVGPVELVIGGEQARFTLECVGNNLLEDAAVGGLALNLRDVTERKQLEEQLRQLAFHDPLTLLANRSLLRDRVEHALALAQRTGLEIAVMFLDLDNFKNVNDTLGHEAGDRLLQTAAQRLVTRTRGTDTVARLGGDEFAILLEGFGTRSDVGRIAAALVASFDEPMVLDGIEAQTAVSIGVAFSQPGDDTEQLLRKADIAMYGAKSAGKSRYVVFEPRMQELLHERLRLEGDIASALKRNEFFLAFQPIIDLDTRELLGLEALVRWRHPEQGVLLPGQFIGVAEESGQIVELDRWVLLEACRSLRGWRQTVANGEGLRIAVNISGRHLQHADLPQDVRHALRISGLEPGNLVIELTESTIMHNTEANLARLTELKKLGVRLAIDDFGTGYSSLSYLHRFPIDILKIDRSFVNRLGESGSGADLARAVVMLGRTLGLETIAEGIEEEDQAVKLLDLGCVAGQGYLFAAPGSLDAARNSPFAERRAELRLAHPDRSRLTATGRFTIERRGRSRSIA